MAPTITENRAGCKQEFFKGSRRAKGKLLLPGDLGRGCCGSIERRLFKCFLAPQMIESIAERSAGDLNHSMERRVHLEDQK
jgi:hypothetical protein